MAVECKVDESKVPPLIRYLPRRHCRDVRRARYKEVNEHEGQSRNAHFLHRLVSKRQTWRDAPIYSQDIAERIRVLSFTPQTAKLFLLSTPNDQTDKYIFYSPISARVTKAAWKFVPNHIVAVTRLLQEGDEWYFYLRKVKKTIDKFDSDERNLEIKKIPFKSVHEFHGVAYLLHELHLRDWNELPLELREMLKDQTRFSNETLTNFLGLRQNKTLFLLQDGSLKLFQGLSSNVFSWASSNDAIEKIAVVSLSCDETKTQDSKWIRVVNHNGPHWLKLWKYHRDELLQNGRSMWQMEMIRIDAIRQVANITQDAERLNDLKDDLDQLIECKQDRAKQREWRKSGKHWKWGYLFEMLWQQPNEFQNEAPEQVSWMHPGILHRVGPSIDPIESMKQELLTIIQDGVYHTLYYGSSFTEGDTSKTLPLSTCMWLYGGPALFGDFKVDVSTWQDDVLSGNKMTVLLNFEQLLQMKREEENYYYCRFRAPRVIHKRKTGLFAHYDRKWVKNYCHEQVLMENACLHLPSDVMMCHLVYLECPVSTRLANASAWHLKISVVNSEFAVESYTFELDSKLGDYKMVISWDHRLNADQSTLRQLIYPYLDQVKQHLQDLMNRHWFKHHNRNARHVAVQKKLGIDANYLHQQLESLVPPLETFSMIPAHNDEPQPMELDTVDHEVL